MSSKKANPKKKLAASKIERARAFKTVEALSADAAESLRESLLEDGGVEEVEFNRSVQGLREEDDFAVLCKIMGTATLLAELGQRPLIKSGFIVPDFLVQFHAGSRLLGIPTIEAKPVLCLVEVKSTDKDRYSIGGSVLKRKRQFASQLGVPLLFAVRFTRITGNAIWSVVWDRDQSRTSLKVEINDMLQGVGRVIWNDFGLLPRPDLRIVRIYDSSVENHRGAGHKDYGSLVGLRYQSKDHDILLDDSHTMIHGAFTSAYGLDIVHEETKGTETRVVLAPSGMLTTFSNLMYRVNHMITDGEGNSLFDSSKIVAHADTDEFKWLVPRAIGEQVCQELVSLGVMFYMHLGEEEEHRSLWNALFNREREARSTVPPQVP